MTYRSRMFIGIALLALSTMLLALYQQATANSIEKSTSVAQIEVTSAPDLPSEPFNYANINLPPYFAQGELGASDNTPDENPITNEGATLGRVLFYDPRLSINDTISCASCHQQSTGFTDPAQFSMGFNGELTGRNSMSLANARFYENGAFFWDERAATLEEQVLLPIQSHVEMGMTLEELVPKIAATSFYPQLFEDAFGSSTVTSERIAQALAQFVRSMVSYQTRFDAGVPINFANLTQQEDRGRQLFDGRARCGRCHETQAQILDNPANIGLDLTTTDPGIGAITGNSNDDGKFKVPSLRNVAISGPYMHDGRFDTLEEVVAFYNNDIQAHPNLAPELRLPDGSPRRLNLNPNEEAALVAFMHTLTDFPLITDIKFSNPFFFESLFIPFIQQAD